MSSRTTSSRTFHRILALSLVLSTGALSLPHAEAAGGRGGSRAPGPAVQADFARQSFIGAVKNLWGLLKDAPPGPPNGQPGNDPKGKPGKEGSGVCPHGNGH